MGIFLYFFPHFYTLFCGFSFFSNFKLFFKLKFADLLGVSGLFEHRWIGGVRKAEAVTFRVGHLVERVLQLALALEQSHNADVVAVHELLELGHCFQFLWAGTGLTAHELENERKFRFLLNFWVFESFDFFSKNLGFWIKISDFLLFRFLSKKCRFFGQIPIVAHYWNWKFLHFYNHNSKGCKFKIL